MKIATDAQKEKIKLFYERYEILLRMTSEQVDMGNQGYKHTYYKYNKADRDLIEKLLNLINDFLKKIVPNNVRYTAMLQSNNINIQLNEKIMTIANEYYKEMIDMISVLGAVNLDYKLISNIQFDGIDHKDAPDYCDAYIVSADYDGVEMTDEQIELLNDDRDYVYEKLMDYLY